MRRFDVLLRILTVLLFILILGAIATLFLPKTNHLKNMQKQKAMLEAENKETERKINEIKQMQEKFNTDPAFVERIGREKMGLVKSNEMIFRLSETTNSREQQ